MVVLREATLGGDGHRDEAFLAEPYNKDSSELSCSPSTLCIGKQALTMLGTDLPTVTSLRAVGKAHLPLICHCV